MPYNFLCEGHCYSFIYLNCGNFVWTTKCNHSHAKWINVFCVKKKRTSKFIRVGEKPLRLYTGWWLSPCCSLVNPKLFSDVGVWMCLKARKTSFHTYKWVRRCMKPFECSSRVEEHDRISKHRVQNTCIILNRGRCSKLTMLIICAQIISW